MFKVDELLKATGGKLVSGRQEVITRGISIDSRTIKPQDAFIAIRGNNFDGHDFIDEAIKKGAACVIRVRSTQYAVRSTKASFIEVKDTTKALGDIARFQRQKFALPVVAVTGSNGKTTAKEMMAWVLSKRFRVLKNEGTKNNQIGLPLTLLNLNSNHQLVVLELGTNHFGEIDYLAKICQPNIGIIINIGPSHLEYLGNLPGVFLEKYKLVENLSSPSIAILNADDDLLKGKVNRISKKTIIFGFGIKNNSDFFASDIKYLNEKLEFKVNSKYKFTLRTLGYYNIYNALSAIAIARFFGIGYKDIAWRLATFNFPASRLNFIKLNQIKFIDDTYNSNPLSLRQALDVLANFRARGRKIFVMGDMLELGNHKELFHRQAGREARGCCDIFITVGKLSKLAAQTARACGFDIKNIFTCESCNEARDILFNKISPQKNDVILIKGSRAMKMEEVFRS